MTQVVLTNWKGIARYMGRGVRTVQRWERDLGLPVRRARSSGKSAVLALPRDLDLWSELHREHNGHDGAQVHYSSLELRDRLAAEIELARALREASHALRSEFSSLLAALEKNIDRLSRRAP
jgi:phage terminase Nu1 subunit (DNA packaging protein)